jgi:predicted HTH transcriptional regulator
LPQPKILEMAGGINVEILSKDTVKLSKNEQKIVRLIKESASITANELSEILGINLRNTKNNIANLKKVDVIERVGPDKGGYWKLTEKETKNNN